MKKITKKVQPYILTWYTLSTLIVRLDGNINNDEADANIGIKGGTNENLDAAELPEKGRILVVRGKLVSISLHVIDPIILITWKIESLSDATKSSGNRKSNSKVFA